MLWVILAFISAALLGFYDVFKKESLKSNAVVPVLFLNTLFSSLIFIPFIIMSLQGGMTKRNNIRPFYLELLESIDGLAQN